MASPTHNLLNSRKAQFFVLSAFAIVAVIFLIGRWIEPYTIIDTSSVALMEEPFLFNNAVEKANETVGMSKTCEDLILNLEEYKNFLENFVLERGTWIIYYKIQSPCKLPTGEEIPTVVVFNLTLTLPQLQINSQFYETWKPS